MDADLVRQFQLKIDFQGQHWNTGGTNTFTPTLLLFGLAYRIPFGPHVRQGTIRH